MNFTNKYLLIFIISLFWLPSLDASLLMTLKGKVLGISKDRYQITTLNHIYHIDKKKVVKFQQERIAKHGGKEVTINITLDAILEIKVAKINLKKKSGKKLKSKRKKRRKKKK